MMGLTSQSAADVLAGVFAALSFRPQRSLVVGVLDERRIPFVARVDLADAAAAPAVLARTVVASATRVRATACVVVAVDAQAPCGGPHARRIGDDVAAALVRAGLDCHDVLTVGPDSFAGAGTGPLPLSMLDATSVAAAHVYAGGVIADSRQALAADVVPTRERHLYGTTPRPPIPAVLTRWLDDLARGATVPTRPGDLLAILGDAQGRDAVLIAAAVPTLTDPADLLTAATANGIGALLDATPDRMHLARAIVLLAALAREAVAPAPVLAVLAWLAWWSGNNPRGELLAARALSAHPRQRLARLTAQLIHTSTPPPWVGHR